MAVLVITPDFGNSRTWSHVPNRVSEYNYSVRHTESSVTELRGVPAIQLSVGLVSLI